MRMPDPQPGWALFLDVDGTLVEHAVEPSAVAVDPGMPALIEALVRATGGALALVSGRTVADLDRLFAPLVLPAAGQHGAQWRTRSRALGAPAARPEALEQCVARLHSLVERTPGLLLEDKGESLALHYRRCPENAALAEAEMRHAVGELGEDYQLLPGSFVFEAKPRAHNKGTAVEAFMREAPFAGKVPVFIGDDRTDEDGFEAVNRLGGHSVKVGQGKTQATWFIPDAARARQWLRDYAARCGEPA